MPLEFAGPGTRLTVTDLAAAATQLNVPVAAVQAVHTIETGGGSGFLPDGRPKILFEAAHFDRLTQGKYRNAYPNLSSPTWNRSLYAHTTEGEYDRLYQAVKLDREAALQAASWGMFQIMGENYRLCGCASVEDFVTGMVQSEGQQLLLFVAFLLANHYDVYLREQAWSAFARAYNGPGYSQNHYDTRLAAAYAAASQTADAPTDLTALVTSTAPTFVTTTTLNVRSGPGVWYYAAGTLPPNTPVQVTQTEDGWAHLMRGNAVLGWVSATYLRTV